MNSFNIHQNPYDQHDAQDAAEQHYLRKADRERSRREEARQQQQQQQLPQQPRQSQQAGKSIQERYPEMNPYAPQHRAPSTRTATGSQQQQQEQRRTQLPQTTYSPYPSPRPLVRKPVSREREERTASPSNLVSSNTPPARAPIAHPRTHRPSNKETNKGTSSSSSSSSSRPTTPINKTTSTSRPSSPIPSSSFFQRFAPGSRRGSNASNTSNNTTSSSRRRGSLTDSLRRASTDLKKNIDLVKMDSSARARWRVAEKARMDSELEERRRAEDSSLRPAYQREYLAWKAARATAATGSGSEVGLNEVERTIALDSALRASSGRGKREAQKERDAQAPLTAGEEIALLVSKAVDPLRKKKERQGSDDSSGMDFADCGAPVDVMECCKRCGRPVGGSEEEGLFLTEGYCPRCHRLRTREFWDSDSPTPSPESSIYSLSPSPRREINEEEYMKLANPTTASRKRIRRVRKTVYVDPGNPFSIPSHSSEDEEDKEDEEEDEEDLYKNDAPPPGFWGPNDLPPDFSRIGRHISSRDEFDSILSSDGHDFGGPDARDEPMHAPTPQRIGTPVVIKQHSMPSSRIHDGDDSLGGFGVERRDFAAAAAASEEGRSEGVVRDSGYYEFYEDVLEEYV